MRCSGNLAAANFVLALACRSFEMGSCLHMCVIRGCGSGGPFLLSGGRHMDDEQAQGSQPARPARTRVLQRGFLEVGNRVVPVQIRNISAQGAMVSGLGSCRSGEAVILRREKTSAAGSIAWTAADTVGIVFADPLNEAEWLPRLATADHEPEHDGLGADGASSATADERTLLFKRISEEQQLIARLLEQVANRLSDDPFVVRRFSKELQALVETADVATSLSLVVNAADPVGEAWKVKIENLRRRLTRD